MVKKDLSNLSTVFEKPVQKSASGALANLFRKLTLKLGLANKLRNLCRNAQLRDKLYRQKLGSSNIDDKLEHRLYNMATGDKLTFEKFTALISHLYDVNEFEFTIRVKPLNSDEWIEVRQEVYNHLGPILEEEDGDNLEQPAKHEHDRKRMRHIKNQVRE